MCDRSSMLIIFLILKIIILVIGPIVLFFLYKKNNKIYNIVAGIDIVFIILFIILKLFGNPCVKNSNFSYLNNYKEDIKIITEKKEKNYNSAFSNKVLTNNENGKDAYFYSINLNPLKEVKLNCDKKSYMNNYGSSITALTTLISNYYGIEINEINIISYLEKNNLIDCDNGIDFDAALKKIVDKYSLNASKISKSDVNKNVLSGKSVLVETKNKHKEKNNFGCELDYIIIYNVNNDGNYNIINSNDKSYSYFCPSNTIGYGSIIEGKQNDRTWTLDEINSKATRYYVLEVK